jgi:hypothetical protein
MQALNIHWISTRRHVTLTGLVLSIAGILCAVWVMLDYQQADAEWQSLQARQARLARANQPTNQPASRSTAVAPPLARDEALSAAQIDTQLQRPWDALLLTLEQRRVENVTLISVEVQAASGNLHLVGEAKDMDHALAYVRLLRQSPELRNVYLSGQEEKDLASGKVVRFSLDANWSAML